MDLYQLWTTYNKHWSQNEIYFMGMVLVFTIGIMIFYVHTKKITVIQAIAVGMLTVFFGIVFGSTIFTRTSTIRQYELLPFWSWLAVIRYHDWGLLKENLLNCILLLPAGALLPLIAAHKVKWSRALAFGIFVSAVIETSQLILKRGLFEWDDMIHNGLGCMIGCLLVNFGMEIWKGMGISMKIQKSIFLISYIIYLFWAIVYVMISNEGAKIDTLIFSVTVASTFFSISDLVYTKIEINKREGDEIVALYFLSKYAEEFYMQKIEDKYGEEAKKNLSVLENALGKRESGKIFQSDLTKDEEAAYLNKVNDIESKQFLKAMIEDDEELLDMLNEDNEEEVTEAVKEKKRRERLYFMLPDILMITGLVSLLMILTLRIQPLIKISNVCTVGAFLAVILNLTVKEYYRSHSLEKLAAERKEIIKNIIVSIQEDSHSDSNE